MCPNCKLERTLVNGTCITCGYSIVPKPAALVSSSSPNHFLTRPLIADKYQPKRGDILRRRYRIVSLYTPSENQSWQGLSWLAIDIQSVHQRVLLREIVIPEHLALASSREQVAQLVAERQSVLAEYPGFPKVIDFFYEQGSYFLAMFFPEGESLTTWLQRQGGILPEYLVAELGFQVCYSLMALVSQQPPMVHGSISPETIIVGTEGQFISLVHVPLLPADTFSVRAEKVSTGYSAPEQVRGETCPSSDLYGLAAVMYHAATGYDPRARLALFHPPARRLNPTVTPQMEKILTRQLSLSVLHRYASPREMQQDLAALLETYPDATGEKNEASSLTLSRLSTSQLRQHSNNAFLLNMGMFAAICVLLIIITIFLIVRP